MGSANCPPINLLPAPEDMTATSMAHRAKRHMANTEAHGALLCMVPSQFSNNNYTNSDRPKRRSIIHLVNQVQYSSFLRNHLKK